MRRFRSCGMSASNIEEYLEKLKEKEEEYIQESTLAHITFISLDEKNNNNNDYDLLKPQSNYKISNYEKIKNRKKRKRIISTQYFRKKIFFHHKRNRINSETINSTSSEIKLFE